MFYNGFYFNLHFEICWIEVLDWVISICFLFLCVFTSVFHFHFIFISFTINYCLYLTAHKKFVADRVYGCVVLALFTLLFLLCGRPVIGTEQLVVVVLSPPTWSGQLGNCQHQLTSPVTLPTVSASCHTPGGSEGWWMWSGCCRECYLSSAGHCTLYRSLYTI